MVSSYNCILMISEDASSPEFLSGGERLPIWRQPLWSKMVRKENSIERELHQIDLKNQRPELQQLEADISQTKAEAETQKEKSERDRVEAVRRMSRSEMIR